MHFCNTSTYLNNLVLQPNNLDWNNPSALADWTGRARSLIATDHGHDVSALALEALAHFVFDVAHRHTILDVPSPLQTIGLVGIDVVVSPVIPPIDPTMTIGIGVQLVRGIDPGIVSVYRLHKM